MDTEGNRRGAESDGQPFEQWVKQFTSQQLFPVVQAPADVARVAVWLVTDEARFITGHALPVDAGSTLPGATPP
jgi:NAD(P)-dependent dehydrogenase (short-subunit alcohol dehydrogenase family)